MCARISMGPISRHTQDHVLVCPVLQKSALILHAIKGERSDSLRVLNAQSQDVISFVTHYK